MGMEALEYRLPKKPVFDECADLYFCPSCGRLTSYSLGDFSDFCDKCGQALKWTE